MSVAQYITDNWYWLVPSLVIILIFIIILVTRKKKHKKKKKGEWETLGFTTYKDKLRLIEINDKGLAIHRPIYTLKQLKEMGK